MQQYIVRRLLFMVFVWWAVSTFVFVTVRVLPGDYTTQFVTARYFSGLGASGQTADEATAIARERLGLDDSIPVQYWKFTRGVASGDFGESFRSREPAMNDVRDALPYSMQLGLMTGLFSIAIGIPIGIVSAIRQDSKLDGGLRLLAIVGLAAPSFWLATMATLVVLQFDLFRIDVVNSPGVWEDPVASMQLFIIPAIAGGFAGGAIIMRLLRSQMLDVLRQDYVRTAWAKGLRERNVILSHAMRNAIIPVITVFGFLISALVSGGVILESMFNIPGMGRTLILAINSRDVPVVQALVLVISAAVLVIHFLVDLSYSIIDPRVKVHE